MNVVEERYTEDAWKALKCAQHEAVALKHAYIGTEHILLGLLRDSACPAARVLQPFDITFERARSRILEYTPSGAEPVVSQLPLTARSGQVLEHALREVLALAQTDIGTEHILLGLVTEREGIAARVISDLGADLDRISLDSLHLLGEASGSRLPALFSEWKSTRRAEEAALRADDPTRVLELRERQCGLVLEIRAEVQPRHNRLLADIRELLVHMS